MIAKRIIIAIALFVAATSTSAQNAEHGRTLYMNICAACHGFPPSGGPSGAGGNPTLISNAINSRVPNMAFLRGVLSASDIADIAEFLINPTSDPGPPPPPPPPPEPAKPTYDVTDLWFNSQEPGWGLNLVQHPTNVVFGVMYTYDVSRRPLWLVMPGGRWSTSLRYEGDLYLVTGPQYNQPTFDPARVDPVKVGTMTIDLNSRDGGTVTFFVNGVRTAKSISRQPF
jgi:hypothetical protein